VTVIEAFIEVARAIVGFTETLDRRRVDIAADELAAEAKAGGQHAEAPRRWIDHLISRQRDGNDQALNQTLSLDLRVDLAIDLFGPGARNAVVAPSPGVDRWLLQHQHIVAAPPYTLALAETQAVPGDAVDRLQAVDNAQVVGLAKPVGVHPPHAVAAWHQHARDLATAGVDIVLAHGRKLAAFALARPFAPERQFIEHAPVLRVEERKRGAGVGQRCQQLERVPALGDITLWQRCDPERPFCPCGCGGGRARAPGHRRLSRAGTSPRAGSVCATGGAFAGVSRGCHVATTPPPSPRGRAHVMAAS